jgi:predicted O-methyltransferase YrrM
MVSGGLLVADNVISHAGDLSGFLDRAESDERMDTMVTPVGEGVLLARRM